MRERIKYFNIVQILGNIFLLIDVIALVINQNDFWVSLYWCLIPFTLIGNVYCVGKWSKNGLNIDKRKSELVNRSLNDTTTVLLVLYTLVYLAIIFIQDFPNCNISLNNLYVFISLYLFTVILEIFIYVIIDNAYNDTKKIIQDKINKRK